MTTPQPERRLRYRLLTGTTEDDLSTKVDEALRAGYELHGDPALTGNAGTLVLAQAVRWPSDDAG